MNKQQESMMKLFVIHKIVGGYAREDAGNTHIVAIVTDSEEARQIAIASGGSVSEKELGVIPPGILADMKVFFG